MSVRKKKGQMSGEKREINETIEGEDKNRVKRKNTEEKNCEVTSLSQNPFQKRKGETIL